MLRLASRASALYTWQTGQIGIRYQWAGQILTLCGMTAQAITDCTRQEMAQTSHNIRIELLNPDEAIRNWQIIKNFIDMTRPHSGGEHSADDFKEMAKSGINLFALIYEGAEPIGCFSIESHQFPQKTIINIPIVAGRDLQKWKTQVLDMADDIARQYGASEIRTRGRRGWARELMKDGFKHEYTILSRAVK